MVCLTLQKSPTPGSDTYAIDTCTVMDFKHYFHLYDADY